MQLSSSIPTCQLSLVINQLQHFISLFLSFFYNQYNLVYKIIYYYFHKNRKGHDMKRFLDKKEKADAEQAEVVDENEDERNEGTPKKQRKFFHKFNESWLVEYPWMKRSYKKGVPFCKLCGVTISGSVSHLKRHERSEKHISNAKKGQFSKRITDIFEDKERLKHRDKVYSAELKLTVFLHEHNVPFSAMEHLPKLIRSCDPDSQIFKDIACSRTKSTAITNECLAAESQEVLLRDLEESGGFYSLIIDETTDVSTKKSLVIVIRFYHEVVQDRFLGLVEVKAANAEALFNSIKDLLRKYELPLENMLGFAADNASTMMGRLTGIQARLRNDNEHIMILGCVCHSLHLCSSAAALKLPKSVEEFVRSLYNHFSNSSKRIQEFQEFQKFVNMKPYKLLKPAQTRWLSLQAVVDRVLLLWNPLNLYFTNLVYEDSKEEKTAVILENLRNPVYKIYLLFLAYILPIVNKMNLQLQSETTQIHILYSRFSTLYCSVLANYIKKDVFLKYEITEEGTHDQNFKKYDLAKINPANPDYFKRLENMYFGACAELYIRENNVPEGEVNKIRINILNFYVELCSQIRKRFPFGDKKFEFLGNFEPKIALSGSVQSISEASVYFKPLVDDIEALNTEWREIPHFSSLKGMESANFESFWSKLFELKNNNESLMFPNLTKFVKGIMCLPHSSASAERVFSQLSLIKSDLRNKLNVGTCQSIMFTKDLIKKTDCFSWQPSEGLLKKKPKYVTQTQTD